MIRQCSVPSSLFLLRCGWRDCSTQLWLQHWDTFADAIQPGVAPETDHASVLWRMSKKRRMALWRELSPKLRVTTLGISGNFSDKCFFDDEEFCALFPHKRSLQSVHTLSLSFCWGLSDYSIDKFIAAGGGSSLKSLRFHCECIAFETQFPCCCFPLISWSSLFFILRLFQMFGISAYIHHVMSIFL